MLYSVQMELPTQNQTSPGHCDKTELLQSMEGNKLSKTIFSCNCSLTHLHLHPPEKKVPLHWGCLDSQQCAPAS